MSNTEVIAYHGWGFDSRCWDEFSSQMPESTNWRCYDRGYFGSPQSPRFSGEAGRNILCVHSFGLHLCSDELYERADELIIFSGFLHFHPKAAQFRRRSKQVVGEMINQLGSQPHQVLKAFYRNVFHPSKKFSWPEENYDNDLLMKDLKKLDEHERSLPPVSDDAGIYIFHGSDDAIVPKQKGRSLYEKFNGRAKYFEITGSGHALPMTMAGKCWNLIESNIFDTV